MRTFVPEGTRMIGVATYLYIDVCRLFDWFPIRDGASSASYLLTQFIEDNFMIKESSETLKILRETLFGWLFFYSNRCEYYAKEILWGNIEWCWIIENRDIPRMCAHLVTLVSQICHMFNKPVGCHMRPNFTEHTYCSHSTSTYIFEDFFHVWIRIK